MLGRNALLWGGETLEQVTQRIMEASSLKVFKVRMDRCLNQPGLVKSVPNIAGWNQVMFKVSSNSDNSVIL